MKTPRPHQRRAIRRILKSLRRRGRDVRCQCIMACGTGKTFIALRVKERLKPDLTVVFVPTLQLVAQLKRNWEEDRRQNFTSFVVCSDSTVVDGWRLKASDIGLRATTNPEKIAGFMQRSGPKVIFCTYQSSERIAKAQAISGVTVDFIVCDEAHRTTGIDGKGCFQVVLDRDQVVAKKRLFMTATPRMFTKTAFHKAQKLGIRLVGMDNEPLYGPVAFEYSFPEAIKDKMLCDYKVVVVTVTDQEVQKAIETRSFLAHQHQQMLVEDVAKHVGLGKAIRKYGLERVVAFVNRVRDAAAYGDENNARGFVQTMSATGVLSRRLAWSAHVEGAMSVAQRQLRLDVLGSAQEGIVRVLYNARCLTEGVDTPAMDAVAFLACRSSVVDIAQTAGRGLRLPPGWVPTEETPQPPTAYIVVPLFVGSGEPEDVRVLKAFAHLTEVLVAMRAIDHRLEAWINEVKIGGAQTPTTPELIDFGGLSSLSIGKVTQSVALRSAPIEPPVLMTEEEVLRWMQEFLRDYGQWPTKHRIPPKSWKGTRAQWGEATPYAGFPLKWKYLDQCLRLGKRGLPGGSSLAKVRERLLGGPSKLTQKLIFSWAKEYNKDTGRWPHKNSGEATPYAGYPLSWRSIDRAVQRGVLGFKTTLSTLMAPLRAQSGVVEPTTETDVLKRQVKELEGQVRELKSQLAGQRGVS